MTALQLMTRLRALGVRLRIDDERLHVSAPPHALTADLRTDIEERKADLVEILRSSTSSGLDVSLFTAERDGEIPLSLAQERLWLLDQLEDGSANIPLVLRLAGHLDTEALRRALAEIVRRHEALRTTFVETDAGPVQRVGHARTPDLTVVDLAALSPGDRDRESGRLIRESLSRAFSLSMGPPMRLLLLRMGAEDHVLAVAVHHIVFDGWSVGIFFDELAVLYGAFSRRSASPLSDPPIQYQDYARWQRRWIMEPAVQGQMRYWRTKIADLPPVLEKLTDHPRPAVQSYRGQEASFRIPLETSTRLAAVGREQGATLFMTLLAALASLLYRWTGQRDIAVGSPMADRRWVETEGVIGCFLNTLVLRITLAGRMTFEELLRRVRDTTVEAQAHQDAPIEKLIESAGVPRGGGHSPLFQVMFALQNMPLSRVSFPGLSVHALPYPSGKAKFDLSIHMIETESGIGGVISSNADLFDPSTIERMIRNFSVLAGAAAERPHLRVMDLPLWGAADLVEIQARRTLRPSTPFVTFPKHAGSDTLASRFEQVADAHARAIAVKGAGREWTYRQLDAKANRVAHDITGCPAGPVALLFGHGAAMIAGIIGSLKAARAYVPLDPAFPAKRLAALVAHAECRLLVTTREHAAVAEGLKSQGIQVILFDERDAGTSRRPSLAIEPDALAYVLYTSGSTGEPKGVVQTHRNVLHFIRVYTNNLHIDVSDRLSLLSTYGFDGSVMDIFGALLNGASLHTYDLRANGFSPLPAWVHDNGITLYHSTPTVFRCLLEGLPGQSRFPLVRLVVLGGEPAWRSDFDLYRRYFSPDCLLVNGLGPTESTVTLQFFAHRDTRLNGSEIPVGWPVDDTEVALLDSGGNLEVRGEIAVRSAYVARGYLKSPAQTRVAFLPDPEHPSVRTYLTGDLGRLLPGGEIVFDGRKDLQVKIRGYRVEPGESEALLRRCPGVRQAVVVPREVAHSGPVLAAYVVAAEGHAVSGPSLRDYLRDQLPDYMVPSAIMMVDSLPLMRNGKLDLSALPPPDTLPVREEYVAPRTDLERDIAACWTSVLRADRVGIHDNFFDLGGDSMSAARLVARLRGSLGIQLPLRALFLAPTVAGLAATLVRDSDTEPWRFHDRHGGWVSLVPMQPRGWRPPFFLVAGAHAEEEQLLRYLSHMIPHLGRDQPVYGFKPRGLDGRNPIQRSVHEMARDYLAELCAFQPQGPYLLGGECVGGVVAFEMARQLRSRGEQVDLLVLLDTLLPTRLNATRLRLTYLLRRLAGLTEHFAFAWRSGVARGAAYLGRQVARRLRLTIPRTDQDRMASRRESVERSYSRILYRYTPQSYPGRLTLVVNEQDYAMDPDLGWQKFAVEGVETRVVPGDHQTRLTQFGRIVAQELRSFLERVADGRQPETHAAKVAGDE